MTIELDLQQVSNCESIPVRAKFEHWLRQALQDAGQTLLTIRVVDREESASLNERYRSKQGPTNVLSFPAELPAEIDLPLLGDIVICAPVVELEALQQAKDTEAHWAHLVIHGVLHLLGYDHQTENQAQLMESREISMLVSLGYADPYAG